MVEKQGCCEKEHTWDRHPWPLLPFASLYPLLRHAETVKSALLPVSPPPITAFSSETPLWVGNIPDPGACPLLPSLLAGGRLRDQCTPRCSWPCWGVPPMDHALCSERQGLCAGVGMQPGSPHLAPRGSPCQGWFLRLPNPLVCPHMRLPAQARHGCILALGSIPGSTRLGGVSPGFTVIVAVIRVLPHSGWLCLSALSG